jgi:hypothetical protein
MEYIDGINYSYLYTNQLLKISDIDKLINVLNSIHASNIVKSDSVSIYSNYSDKLIKRYEQNVDLYKSYGIDDMRYNFIDFFNQYQKNNLAVYSVIHGDAVFTNILQTKTGIKFIDMRGKQGDVNTIYGDRFYDYAKIYQSLMGYDYILNGIEMDYSYTNELKNYFESTLVKEQLKNIKFITASLLYTLLPLHEHDENKFRKYIKIINELQNN